MSAPLSLAFLVDSVPFTKAVIAGETSLGGSESACLGLARALRARGHDVHIFATQLDPDAGGPDHAGVTWHAMDDFRTMNLFIEWDVVIALRMFAAFAISPIYARLRILWSQDLLVPGAMQHGMMSIAWAIDTLAYVSEYHRRQWEQLQPELTPLGWVTRNGFDPADLPAEPKRNPKRIIHISRPERGLGPLLAMWPKLKELEPDAELQVCRYSSMYDTGPGSWSDVCASFDQQIAALNAQVGGITYLGELNKRQLYQAVSDAAVMWYPGVSTFAETNCIAALEAEACGTPFVGSYRGALPDTSPTGILIRGDATSPEYQAESIAAVRRFLTGCAVSSFEYRRIQKDGRAHAQRSTYAALAADWEARINDTFQQRCEGNRFGVLRQLLHEDDHTAARVLAAEIVATNADQWGKAEAQKTIDFCDYVIAGKDQTAEHYGSAAIADPLKEADASDRFAAVVPRFEGCSSVLDVACGNGSFAIALARSNPTVHIHGLDYSQANIDRAREGAERAGVADRCIFERCTVYDFDEQRMHVDWLGFVGHEHHFDGLFVGEFIEHIGKCTYLVEALEVACNHGAVVVYTCPHGACAELIPRGMPLRRGHVHRFHHDDLRAVFGPKQDAIIDYLSGGHTERGVPIGNWIVRYQVAPGRPAGVRPLASRIQRTRPLLKLSVGMIVKDAETDLGRCLASVYKVADEIVIGDTGSTDSTKAIAESYGARVIDLPPLVDQPEGFAGARNQVLKQCSGDWFLWIDADEQLQHGYWLRRYLDGQVFHGYVLHQQHLYLDGPPTHDIPVRVFRNTGKVQFYGCVHEQPQDGDPNADIYPTLDIQDVTIAHFGYLTQEGREEKRRSRNLPLLFRDQQVFPTRVLGQVLLLREAVIQADLMCAVHGGQLTPQARQGYAHAIRIFLNHFDHPSHKFHQIARPWYEAALRHLGLGWEMEIAMAGRQGGLTAGAAPERLWVRDAGEYQRIIAFKADAIAKAMVATFATFITDPDLLPARQIADPVIEPAREAVSA